MANQGFPRARRLAETVKRLVMEWLEHQPPELGLGWVTVTDVRVSGDLRHAKVYFTVLDPEVGAAAEAAGREETVKTLLDRTTQARTWVAQRVRLRFAPTLEFREDDVAQGASTIDRLLAELGPPGADPPDPERPQA